MLLSVDSVIRKVEFFCARWATTLFQQFIHEKKNPQIQIDPKLIITFSFVSIFFFYFQPKIFFPKVRLRFILQTFSSCAVPTIIIVRR